MCKIFEGGVEPRAPAQVAYADATRCGGHLCGAGAGADL